MGLGELSVCAVALNDTNWKVFFPGYRSPVGRRLLGSVARGVLTSLLKMPRAAHSRNGDAPFGRVDGLICWPRKNFANSENESGGGVITKRTFFSCALASLLFSLSSRERFFYYAF